jgi:hypothetical protein
MQKDLHIGNVVWKNYEKPVLCETTELFSKCPSTSKDSKNKTDRATMNALCYKLVGCGFHSR